MFIIGFICGFLLVLILITICYLVVRELLYKYGKRIVKGIESELNNLEKHTMDRTEIIEPSIEKEAIEKDLSIEDLLK